MMTAKENVIRTLFMNGNWRLSGADERFARRKTKIRTSA